MIEIIAENFVKPEEIQSFLEKIAPLVAKSSQEDGCISYELFQDEKDETHFVIIEAWKDEEAIAIHNASEHFTRIIPEIKGHCSKPGIIKIYRPVSL